MPIATRRTANPLNCAKARATKGALERMSSARTTGIVVDGPRHLEVPASTPAVVYGESPVRIRQLQKNRLGKHAHQLEANWKPGTRLPPRLTGAGNRSTPQSCRFRRRRRRRPRET